MTIRPSNNKKRKPNPITQAFYSAKKMGIPREVVKEILIIEEDLELRRQERELEAT